MSSHASAGAIDAAELLAAAAVGDHERAWQIVDRIACSDHAREALFAFACIAGGFAGATADLRRVPIEQVIDEALSVAGELSLEIDMEEDRCPE